MLPEFVRHHAQTRPDAPAIKQGATVYTYGRLDRLAGQAAHQLLERVGPPPALVGLLSTDPAVQLILAFGAWKAGMTIVMLDPREPVQRLKQVLTDAEADAVVTSRDSIHLSPALERQCILMEFGDHRPASFDPVRPTIPDGPAAIVYTSGSMGQPKGVVRTHTHLFRQAQAECQRYAMTSMDRISLMFPLNFGLGLKNALTALLDGATLCPFNPVTEGLTPFHGWLQDEEITILLPPVGFLRSFLNRAEVENPIHSCRHVCLTDKMFKRDVDNFWRFFAGPCTLAHVYGSSETGDIARYCIERSTRVTDPIPVGYPVEGVELKILDENGIEQPAGAIGEIAVIGRDLPTGYWQDPEATARRYRDLPGPGGSRMCLTGDLGTITDGLLYLHGRKDDQFKVRGYRVDLSEIETALNSLQGVAGAVVKVSEDIAGEKKLTAYVNLSGGTHQTVRTLRKAVADRLPGFMVPAIVILDEIPTTTRGKVDRQALPASPPGAPNR